MHEQKPEVRDAARPSEKKMTDAIVADLKAALTEFKAQLPVVRGKAAAAGPGGAPPSPDPSSRSP